MFESPYYNNIAPQKKDTASSEVRVDSLLTPKMPCQKYNLAQKKAVFMSIMCKALREVGIQILHAASAIDRVYSKRIG